MSGGHVHTEGAPPRASERTTGILTAIVGVIVFVTAMGAAAVWPKDFTFWGAIPTTIEGTHWVTAEIIEADPNGGTAYVVGDRDAGPQTLLPTGDPTLTFDKGDRIRALQMEDGNLAFADFERGSPMLVLAIAFVISVLIVARWRGLGALFGLVLAFGIVLFFTIPALFSGGNPLIIGLVTGAGALFVLLYLAHGPNARTTTAYLGTLAGLIVTAVLAWWAVGSSKLLGYWSEDGTHLELTTRGVSLQGVVVCGTILAGMGVLNDVTVTQASAIWELRAARPDLGWWQLFVRGMRIGRDHIASTVYTIAFAYVGAALPMFMFIMLFDRGIGTILTSSDIAEEIVRTLVGSIGLVLAVPLTTLIGALVVAGGEGPPPRLWRKRIAR